MEIAQFLALECSRCGRNCCLMRTFGFGVSSAVAVCRIQGVRRSADSYDSTGNGRHRANRMAGYREHITVSGTLGLAYGFAAAGMFAFSITQSMIAGILTWIAGMLPDLDSSTGRPIKELFGLTAALAPLLLLQHTSNLGISGDRAMLFALLLYGAVRYGGATLLSAVTVHRGMFHSIPALIIAAEITFLCYYSPSLRVRTLMGLGVALGFLSHLVLDEMYSVQWDGTRVRLKRSAGSALKFFGPEALPNGLALGLMMFLSYATLMSSGLLPDPQKQPAPEMLQITEELDSAPAFRMADEPSGTSFQ